MVAEVTGILGTCLSILSAGGMIAYGIARLFSGKKGKQFILNELNKIAKLRDDLKDDFHNKQMQIFMSKEYVTDTERRDALQKETDKYEQAKKELDDKQEALLGTKYGRKIKI